MRWVLLWSHFNRGKIRPRQTNYTSHSERLVWASGLATSKALSYLMSLAVSAVGELCKVITVMCWITAVIQSVSAVLIWGACGFIPWIQFEMRPKKAEGTTSRALFTLTTYSAVSLKEPSAFPVVITTKPFHCHLRWLNFILKQLLWHL